MDMRDENVTQAVRVLDVAIIGPLMIYAGLKCKDKLPNWARYGLIGFGATTIAYNGKNYLDADRERELRVIAEHIEQERGE